MLQPQLPRRGLPQPGQSRFRCPQGGDNDHGQHGQSLEQQHHCSTLNEGRGRVVRPAEPATASNGHSSLGSAAGHQENPGLSNHNSDAVAMHRRGVCRAMKSPPTVPAEPPSFDPFSATMPCFTGI